MKITNVEVFLTGTAWRNFLFVKLTTDDGLVGWGDGTLEWKESAVRELILDFGRRYVIGMSPFNIEALWFKLYQVEHNTGPIMFAAMAGIETAMWDLVGKALGQPVYNLVGGAVRKSVEAYANGWYAFKGDLAKIAERAQEVVGRGYKAMKFDPFGPGGRELSKRATQAGVPDCGSGANRGGRRHRSGARIPWALQSDHGARSDSRDGAVSAALVRGADSRAQP